MELACSVFLCMSFSSKVSSQNPKNMHLNMLCDALDIDISRLWVRHWMDSGLRPRMIPDVLYNPRSDSVFCDAFILLYFHWIFPLLHCCKQDSPTPQRAAEPSVPDSWKRAWKVSPPLFNNAQCFAFFTAERFVFFFFVAVTEQNSSEPGNTSVSSENHLSVFTALSATFSVLQFCLHTCFFFFSFSQV